MSFAHLHVHTEYSLLDGFSNIKKLVERAKQLEMPAIAITDHGSMFGVIDFYNAANAAGVKPIIGMEAYMAARGMQDRDSKLDRSSHHLLLLAENETGYKNLLKIASAAQLNGFYYYPRIDHDFLAAHAQGLICTSGCMSAEIPRALLEQNPQEAVRRMDWYYEVFGPERFYVELQHHNIKEITELNRQLVELGARYSAKYVATNDVHYIDPEDARLQDILLAIQTNSLLSDKDRMTMTDNSYYLRTAGEMANLFAEVPESLSNTLLIAERCNVDLSFKGYHLPEFEVPEGYTPQTYLRHLCEQGAQRRFSDHADSQQVRERLDYELGVIHDMGFDAYFLIVWDLCRYARENGIWYNARGSAAGSIVAYTLDITLVDPLEHDLIFERFLNPGRISMPDIDLDFRDDRRAEMLEYCARKFGEDRVAQIITFGTMGAKAAIRDVGRVMDIPLPEVDRIAKLVPFVSGKTVSLREHALEVPEFKKIYESEPHIKELVDTAMGMEGTVRNAGTHAAGVVISDKPLIEYLPLHRPTSNSEETPIKSVTQFEMGILDSLGMLKVDFLGLATLTTMARACDLIHERHAVSFNLDSIPLDDRKAFELLGSGQTAGVFQLEGGGMTRWLVQMKPQNLDNVIAMVALYRPGPMQFIPDYIARMHGEAEVEYRHDDLRPIYEETYGIPVYQEQLMNAAVKMAGYTQAEADDLRKAISKKIGDKVRKHRHKFVKGATTRGVTEETANLIFTDWEEFARYGFNKCLPGEVEVVDAGSGRLVKVEDLFHQRATLKETVSCEIPSLKLQVGQVTAVMDNGRKPVFRLTTALGRTIEATGNHPFYTYAGWQQLDDLQPDDFIAVPRIIPVEGHNQWPDHKVIALGHLLAEGNLCHPHSVYYYSQDEDQVRDFITAANSFDNVACTIAVHKNTFSVYAARKDRRTPPELFTWIGELGLLGKTARDKEIPAPVFELNNTNIGLLLSRMWEGDSHIDTRGRSLFYATASLRLAQQIQHLLLRFGIISRLRTVEFPNKEGRIGYQLFVTGYENMRVFSERIGKYFVSQKRKDQLKALTASIPPMAIGTKDILPLEVKEHIRSAKEKSDLTWSALTSQTGIAQREFFPTNSAGKVGFRRATLSRLGGFFDDPAIRRYAESDLYWDRIATIEYIGEKQTYDLEIAEKHNFIANDILVHNSHAADYGVLAVQTAYLKAHYPAEYMTALLSVTRNDTAKVALYVADARNLGVPVLPPDINASDWDFTIEDLDSGPAIRFGLSAVKNVGEAPVNVILEARKERPFSDLNDFARRVDLRTVGKRALECMVKVGALDSFGVRSAMLASLDRIVALSNSHFQAARAGQLSLFGAATGVTENIILPDISDVDQREMLNWERELIGLYLSDHPLSVYQKTLAQLVSYFSGQLPEAQHEEKVRVAGLVTNIRPYQTKAGKPMGFVTIEDIQGVIDLVLFSRPWKQFSDLLEVGSIIIVEGKVDANSSPPKILADSIQTEYALKVSADELNAPPPADPEPAPAPPKRAPALDLPARQTSAPPPPLEWDTDGPPPPENFPADWEQTWQPSFEAAKMAAQPEPKFKKGEPISLPPETVPAPDPEPEPADPIDVQASSPEITAVPDVAPEADGQELYVQAVEQPIHAAFRLPSLYVPVALSEDRAHPPQQITVLLRPTGDPERDKRRIKTLYGTLISFHGQDRFSFQIYEGEKGHLIDFPNDTTRLCPEMLARLKKLIGQESWRIEQIALP